MHYYLQMSLFKRDNPEKNGDEKLVRVNISVISGLYIYITIAKLNVISLKIYFLFTKINIFLVK